MPYIHFLIIYISQDFKNYTYEIQYVPTSIQFQEDYLLKSIVCNRIDDIYLKVTKTKEWIYLAMINQDNEVKEKNVKKEVKYN